MNCLNRTFLFFFFILIFFEVKAQMANCRPLADPRGHSLTSPNPSASPWRSFQSLNAGEHDNTSYIEENLCSDDGYILVMEDQFNGNVINKDLWQGGDMETYASGHINYCTPFDDPEFCYVDDGTLNLFCKHNFNSVPNSLVPEEFWYRSGQIISKRTYPAGKIEVRCLIEGLPDNDGMDVAPIWLQTNLGLNYSPDCSSYPQYNVYNEIDVELLGDHTEQGQYTLHADQVSNLTSTGTYQDNTVLRCSNSNINYSDGQYHIFRIEWDMYRVNWYVDNRLVSSLYRTYRIVTLGFLPIPIYLYGVRECDGAPASTLYVRHNSFPLLSNMQFLMGVGGNVRHEDINIHLKTDYIKYWRKIKCDKTVDLHEFRTSGGKVCGCLSSSDIQFPPNINNETPSVVTGGTINVAGDDNQFLFRRNTNVQWRQCNLDLKATEEINLLPGFESDLLYQTTSGTSACKYFQTSEIRDVFSANIVSCPSMNKTEEEIEKFEDKNYEMPQIDTAEILKNIDEYMELYKKMQEKGEIVPSDIGYTLNIAPNPATSIVTLSYFTPVDGNISIDLYDMNQHHIETMVNSYKMIGQNESFIPLDNLSSGIYFVVMQAGDTQVRKKLVVVK